MVSIDAILLGIVVVGIITGIPIGAAGVIVLLWGTRPSGRVHRH